MRSPYSPIRPEFSVSQKWRFGVRVGRGPFQARVPMRLQPWPWTTKSLQHPDRKRRLRKLQRGAVISSRDLHEEECVPTSLVVQWLRLCASTAGGEGLIPGQGSSSCCVVRSKANKEKCASDNSGLMDPSLGVRRANGLRFSYAKHGDCPSVCSEKT